MMDDRVASDHAFDPRRVVPRARKGGALAVVYDVSHNIAKLEAAGSVRGLLEEAPQSYKDVDKVVDMVAMAGMAMKVAHLRPVAIIKGCHAQGGRNPAFRHTLSGRRKRNARRNLIKPARHY
jgi:hypothetical protein